MPLLADRLDGSLRYPVAHCRLVVEEPNCLHHFRADAPLGRLLVGTPADGPEGLEDDVGLQVH